MPPLLLSFGRRSETCPGSYVLPGTLREREGSRPWAGTQAVGVALIFFFLWHALHAGRAINARPIWCCVCQITITFWMGATLEVGAANQARWFGFDLLWQVTHVGFRSSGVGCKEIWGFKRLAFKSKELSPNSCVFNLLSLLLWSLFPIFTTKSSLEMKRGGKSGVVSNTSADTQTPR